MIPKTIHYCWFGNKPKSELILKCINSWNKYLPDYQVVEWNETNFDTKINSFVIEAYNRKMWAFVSDYVRAYVLFNCGGIYLDTDVEIRQSLDSFLIHSAFTGFEKVGYPFTALWGSVKNHNLAKDVLEYYNSSINFEKKTNTVIVSDILLKNYNVNPHKNELQILKNDLYIYPSTYFCLNIEQNYAVHHFEGSWLETEKSTYGDLILKNHYKNEFLKIYEGKSILNELYNDNLFSKKDLITFIVVSSIKKIKSFIR